MNREQIRQRIQALIDNAYQRGYADGARESLATLDELELESDGEPEPTSEELVAQIHEIQAVNEEALAREDDEPATVACEIPTPSPVVDHPADDEPKCHTKIDAICYSIDELFAIGSKELSKDDIRGRALRINESIKLTDVENGVRKLVKDGKIKRIKGGKIMRVKEKISAETDEKTKTGDMTL